MERSKAFTLDFPGAAYPEAQSYSAPRPRWSWRNWEVARWGRLLAGLGVLFFTALGLLHDPLWLIGTLALALNLVVTSITDHCAMRNMLLRLGAKEREALFLPDGKSALSYRTSYPETDTDTDLTTSGQDLFNSIEATGPSGRYPR